MFQKARSAWKLRKSTPSTALNTEIYGEFRSLESFWEWMATHQDLVSSDYLTALANGAFMRGAIEPLTNRLIPPQSFTNLENLREGLTWEGINSRMRAVLLCMANEIASASIHDPSIYAAEAVTPFALRCRGMFPRFIGSEFCPSKEQQQQLFPIQHEDLLSLSYPSDSFDFVITNEVLEHVPTIEGALRELYRILRPGGWHLGTVPFCHGQEEYTTKAQVVAGEIIHLMEPEYHVNPVDPKGSLVFQLPGWGILKTARDVGFTDAHMKLVLSARHGCLTELTAGVLVLALRK